MPDVTWRPLTRSGWLDEPPAPAPALRMKFSPLKPTSESNTWFWSRTSLRFATEKLISGTCSDHSVRKTRRSASGYGSGRSRIALMTLKIAVLAPIPSASVATATSVKPGEFRSVRAANRTSRQSSSMVSPSESVRADRCLSL